VEILLILVHVFVCIVLIFVVLLQSGKAADLAGAFGGGGSQTALGSRGAVTVLAKATSICAILFMLTSLALALYGSRGASSVLDSTPIQAPADAATPAAPAAAPPEGGAPLGAAPAADQAAPSGAAPAEGVPPGQQPAGQPPPGSSNQ
jgi:preprotein translocase subunit SecG